MTADDRPTLVEAVSSPKRFGSSTAVDGVDFEVEVGEAFGFLGPTARRVMHCGMEIDMETDAARPAPPIACSLDAAGIDDRLSQWSALLAGADGLPEATAGGRRLHFEPGQVNVSELAALAEAEVACCPFFTFTLSVHVGGTTLEVSGPPDAGAAVDTLLGAGA